MRTFIIIKSVFIIVLCAIPFQSCDPDKGEHHTISGYVHEPLPNGKGINVNLEELTQLEYVQGISLNSPQQVEIQDSSVIIRDVEGVYAFHKNGRFIRQYGKKGRGKGEYINLSAFFIDKDGGVAIVDEYRKKILHYDQQGKFLAEEKAKGNTLDYVCSVVAVPGAAETFCTYMINPENDEMYSVLDSNLNRRCYYNSGLKSQGSAEVFGWHPVSKFGNLIRYIKPYDSKIYTYGTDDVVEISIGDLKKTNSEKAGQFTLMGMLNQLIAGEFIGFTDIYETPKYILLGVSNYSYVIVDKSSLTCKHYKYSVPDVVEDLPLLNIVASSEDMLYGLITPMKVMIDSDVKSNNRDFDKILKSFKDMELTDNPILVTYRLGGKE